MLDQVQKPTRYTGGEMNTQLKPWDSAKLHFAFCFPDTYEVGMSHLGMKILYAAMNQQSDMLCERAFMPWVDMIDLMKQENVPLFTLESRSPLSAFDVVGFTLQYEMSYSNILAMLELGGIPLLRENRREEDPIVVAGGPCAFNPEPLADFIDAFMVGDGEEQILDLNRVIMQGREEGASRMTILKRLCAIRGVYVPALYDVQYNADGTIASMKPNCPEAPEKVLKAIIPDLDKAFYPTEIPVPYMEIIHDRIMLEIMRGCTRGCRFCQAGILYRPVRERSLEHLVELAQQLENTTGYEEISLSSLSSGDYTCLAELIRELIRRLDEKHVSISLPSLRLDSVLKDSLEATQKEKKTSLTFAPEAGTQRLRDAIAEHPDIYDMDIMPAESFRNEKFITVGLRNQIAKAREAGIDLPVARTILITGMSEDEIWVNMSRVNGVDPTDPGSYTRGEIEARKQVYRIRKYLRQFVPGFENAWMDRVAPFMGIRESRVTVGKYVLTAEDILACRHFDDAIAVASYPVDLHHPKGGDCTLEYCGDCYDIPYRVLVPEKVENLLVAGRCASFTHEAMASTRVMSTCMALGEAAGRAARIALRDGVKPSQADVAKLRSELKRTGAYLR